MARFRKASHPYFALILGGLASLAAFLVIRKYNIDLISNDAEDIYNIFSLIPLLVAGIWNSTQKISKTITIADNGITGGSVFINRSEVRGITLQTNKHHDNFAIDFLLEDGHTYVYEGLTKTDCKEALNNLVAVNYPIPTIYGVAYDKSSIFNSNADSEWNPGKHKKFFIIFFAILGVILLAIFGALVYMVTLS